MTDDGPLAGEQESIGVTTEVRLPHRLFERSKVLERKVCRDDSRLLSPALKGDRKGDHWNFTAALVHVGRAPGSGSRCTVIPGPLAIDGRVFRWQQLLHLGPLLAAKGVDAEVLDTSAELLGLERYRHAKDVRLGMQLRAKPVAQLLLGPIGAILERGRDHAWHTSQLPQIAVDAVGHS